MSIVPWEVVDDWAGYWADTVVRGGPDLHEYIATRAAAWALSQAIEACESIVTECAEIEDRQGAGAAIGCQLRILNILTGGESDGQN
jgi:hypothetical protein